MNSFVVLALTSLLAAANAGLLGAPVAVGPVPVALAGPAIVRASPVVVAGPAPIAYAHVPLAVGPKLVRVGRGIVGAPLIAPAPVAYAAPAIVRAAPIGVVNPAPLAVKTYAASPVLIG